MGRAGPPPGATELRTGTTAAPGDSTAGVAAAGPPPKGQRGGDNGHASIALVHNGRILLTRERRQGASKLSLPGGKSNPGEIPREAREETGMQLSRPTRDRIAAIATWTPCRVGREVLHVGALHLADDDHDATVHTRFDHATANAQPPGARTRILSCMLG